MSFETDQYEAPTLLVMGALEELTMKKVTVTSNKIVTAVPDGIKFQHVNLSNS